MGPADPVRPAVRMGPWRDSANQDYWLLTQSQTDWLHPFELLGPVASYIEFRALVATCADYLSKDAARGNATPDRILRSPRFQACNELSETSFRNEVESWRWHRREWFALKQVIEGACADGILSIGERRLIRERSRACGFDDGEIQNWIRGRWPDIQEQVPEALLRRVLSEDIADGDAFVTYVTSSQERWFEAIRKRDMIVTLAPYLPGPEGRHFEVSVDEATNAVSSFKLQFGIQDSPDRDGGLWLLALVWKAGSEEPAKPAIRLPHPWDGMWCHDYVELVSAVDTLIQNLDSCLDDLSLYFWLYGKGAIPLVQRLMDRQLPADHKAWEILWALGEYRFRINDSTLDDADALLAYLVDGPPTALLDIDRYIDTRLPPHVDWT